MPERDGTQLRPSLIISGFPVSQSWQGRPHYPARTVSSPRARWLLQLRQLQRRQNRSGLGTIKIRTQNKPRTGQ